MLQVAISKGEISVIDVPEPVVRPEGVLVRTSHSLISVGTESAGIGGGGRRENLVLKALRNPALVRKVLDRVSSHGLKNTLELVRDRVSTDLPTGYSCAGVVIEVGSNAGAFRPGDRVACCGTGYANHAAVNFIPKILAAPIPESVSYEEAAFGTLGAIALQGVRRCGPSLGDRIVVLGLGLLGQLTAQLLTASGCYVIGVDVLDDRINRALSLGMTEGFNGGQRELVSGVLERTQGRGADAVIVTAATGDPALLNQAFEACRRKGRVVLVGDVPIRIQRDKIYKKELDFLISTSYGPGRYDPEYEEHGRDYPFGYVRWTEGRNLEETLRLIAAGSLKVKPLTDAVHPIEKASEAYASLVSETRPIGVLLDYHLDRGQARPQRNYVPRRATSVSAGSSEFQVGVIGYGSYFRSVLLPLLRAHRAFALASVCARTGLTVRAAVEKEGFARGTTDYRELLADPSIQVVYVSTRHDQHYPIARAAIEAGKSVFVEKPMTMTAAEGRILADLVAERKSLLTVGFNRRFSPHATLLKKLLLPITGPKLMTYRINAGPLPADHWLLDPTQGGGRILGEGVHFFDFLTFLAGAPPGMVHSSPVGRDAGNEATVTLEFPDGSVGIVAYSAGGARSAGKERVEVFAGGATLILEDFRTLQAFGIEAKGLNTPRIEKGQKEQLDNFAEALAGRSDLGVTAEDGYIATLCAEKALMSPERQTN